MALYTRLGHASAWSRGGYAPTRREVLSLTRKRIHVAVVADSSPIPLFVSGASQGMGIRTALPQRRHCRIQHPWPSSQDRMRAVARQSRSGWTDGVETATRDTEGVSEEMPLWQ